jgi:DNA-binding transcriptional ArsR family regulator
MDGQMNTQTAAEIFPAGMKLEDMRAHAGDAAQLLKALANDNRLMILCVLAENEASVSQLNERIDLSQSALSQHLALLRRDGLVRTRRSSQTIFYSLKTGPAMQIIALLHDIYCSTPKR